MVLKSLRYILGFGIVGSLALAIAPGVRAQVEVTGGEVTGDAAFFVPGMTPGMTPGTPNSQGKIELFDVGVRTLRIESPNGVTTRSRFVPTAARFTDTNNNRTPDRGDTFILQGGLSGVGFTQTGRLVTFSGRDTVLNATLDSFSEQFNVPGALISPAVLGETPLVFLPGLQNVTVQGNEFIATGGELQVGDFAADLDSGLIDLPPTLRFRDSGGGSTPPDSGTIEQRIKFKFEGRDLAAGSYLFDGTSIPDGIHFVGDANHKFEIETAGAGSRGFRFKIKGEGGIVDATLGEAFAAIDDGLDLDKFKIEGKQEGELGFASVFSAYGTRGIAFSSIGEDGKIKYEFEQGGGKFKGEATSIAFRAFPGLSDVSDIDIDTDDGYEFDDSFGSDNEETTPVCNVCAVNLDTDNDIAFGGTTIFINNNNQIEYSGSGTILVFDGTGATGTRVTAEAEAEARAEAEAQANSNSRRSGNPYNTNVSGLAGSESTAHSQFSISNSMRLNSVSTVQGRINVDYQETQGNRYIIATRTSRGSTLGRSGYKLVGPSSRCFPGLVGLRQIPDEETETVCQTGGCYGDDDDISTTPDDDTTTPEDDDTNVGEDEQQCPAGGSCPVDGGDDDGGDDEGDDDGGDDDEGDDEGDDEDDDSQGQNNVRPRANQGIGNGPEGADPGNSQPRGGSNDEGGRTPGGRDR